jgi:hypothetical protein
MFGNVGTGSIEDLKYFSQETKDIMEIMKSNFSGKLTIMNNPWLLDEPEIINGVEFINFSIFGPGYERFNSANINEYNVKSAKNAILMDQLNSEELRKYDAMGKIIIFNLTIQSRSNALSNPEYLEESNCVSTIGSLNPSNGNCLQREISPDYSIQAIFFEAAFEALNSMSLSSNIIPLAMDYWQTDSMVSNTVFPSLGSTIRNKPAEGILKAWYAK